MIITDEDNNEKGDDGKAFDCQNGHYKLTGKSKNTPFHFSFKLLQSNNPISIQILNKFWNWRGGGARGIRGGGIAPLPPSGYGPVNELKK